MDSKDQDIKATKEMIKLRHRMVYDITTRLESFSLNTVISGSMTASASRSARIITQRMPLHAQKSLKKQ